MLKLACALLPIASFAFNFSTIAADEVNITVPFSGRVGTLQILATQLSLDELELLVGHTEIPKIS